MVSKTEIPVALSIAGFDGSGGAGILADTKTFHGFGVYGVGALTAVTAQSPGSVSGVEPVCSLLFEKQLAEIARSFPVSAAKTGMLTDSEKIEIAGQFFERHPNVPLVVDPVLKATAGNPLTSDSAISSMREHLFPRAVLITPNVPEAETIVGFQIETVELMKEAVRKISKEFGCDSLLKGGHFGTETTEIRDVLCLNGEVEEMLATRLDVPELHGTGCVLSAGITACLAKGMTIGQAVVRAQQHLRIWMAGHHHWEEPSGGVNAINLFEGR